MSGSTTYYVRVLNSSGTPITTDTGQQFFDVSAADLGVSNPVSTSTGVHSFDLSLTGLDSLATTLGSDLATSTGVSEVEVAGYNGSALVSDDIFGNVFVNQESESNTSNPTFQFFYGKVQQTLYKQGGSGGAVQQSQSNYDYVTKKADYSVPVSAPTSNVLATSSGPVATQYTLSFLPYLVTETISTSTGPVLVEVQHPPVSSSSFGVGAFSFGVNAPPNLGSQSSGSGAGKIDFSALNLTFAASDQGLPAFTAGETLGGINILGTAPSASGPSEVVDYQFSKVSVKSVSTDQTGAETLGLSFGGIKETYPPSSGGTPSSPPIVGSGAPGSGGTPSASASAISVPSSDQTQTTTGVAPVTPFASVSISDANSGSPTETVTVTPTNLSLGKLSDPNTTDGSTSGNGAITLTGSAKTVSSELDGLKFTPAFGQFGNTSFTIADTNSTGQAASNSSVSVTVNPPPAPTASQLEQIGADVLQFYKDSVSHQPTAADVTKLGGDFTVLDISQAELGQLLGQALTSAMVGGSAATALGTDIANIYYPKITSDLSNGGTGLANDLTAMIGTTVGAGADDLFRLHQGQGASAALAGAVTDFKLG